MCGVFTVPATTWRLAFGCRSWLPAAWPLCWQSTSCPFLLGDGRSPGMAQAGWRGKHSVCLPSARLQILLSVSKEDPPQKYSTKQTKRYFFREVCHQECTDQTEIGHEIWANQGRNRELKIISSSSLPSADGLQLLVCTTLVTPESLGAPPRRSCPSPKAKPQAQELHQKCVLSKSFLPTFVGAGLNCKKQHPTADSLILILRDAQQSRRCMKPEKAMKVNSSFSKAN